MIVFYSIRRHRPDRKFVTRTLILVALVFWPQHQWWFWRLRPKSSLETWVQEVFSSVPHDSTGLCSCTNIEGIYRRSRHYWNLNLECIYRNNLSLMTFFSLILNSFDIVRTRTKFHSSENPQKSKYPMIFMLFRKKTFL